MTQNPDACRQIAQMQLFQAAICEHTAAVWIGDDDAVTLARAKVVRQAEAILDAQETMVIGMKKGAP